MKRAKADTNCDFQGITKTAGASWSQEQPPNPEELAVDPEAAAAAVHRRIRRIAEQAFWDARAEVCGFDFSHGRVRCARVC